MLPDTPTEPETHEAAAPETDLPPTWQPWTHVTAALCDECGWAIIRRTYRSARTTHHRTAQRALARHFLTTGHDQGEVATGSAEDMLTRTRTPRGSQPVATAPGLPATGR